MSSFITMQLQISAQAESFSDICFAIFSLLLEKGHRIFDGLPGKSNGIGRYIALAASFALLVLSNEYRGDNFGIPWNTTLEN